jgi:hypothetical protein
MLTQILIKEYKATTQAITWGTHSYNSVRGAHSSTQLKSQGAYSSTWPKIEEHIATTL